MASMCWPRGDTLCGTKPEFENCFPSVRRIARLEPQRRRERLRGRTAGDCVVLHALRSVPTDAWRWHWRRLFRKTNPHLDQ